MYKKRSVKELRKEVKATSEKMVKDVENYTRSPEQVKEMLDFMSRFHQYSFRNQALIRGQRPGAAAIGSFKKFKDLGYSVQKGEKSIKVWAPSTETVYQFRNEAGMLISIPAGHADARIKAMVQEGRVEKKTREKFRLVPVFDATQTNMPVKDYPKLYPNRPMDYTADPKLVKELAAATKQWVRDTGVSEVKLENITAVSALTGVKDEGEKGFSTPRADHQLIAIRDSLPESDKIAVRIHEMAHNALHGDKRTDKTKAEKEFQAEMTSYVVCKHFGLDTAENATQYIASWTKEDKGFQALSVKERGALLSDVQKTAKGFIDDISEQLAQGRNREQVRAKQQARGLELE
jgi:hypothetical protein